MEGKITKYKFVKSEIIDGKNKYLDSFELEVNKMIKQGWVPLGGPARTAICRGRLTVEEHTMVQAMVTYSQAAELRIYGKRAAFKTTTLEAI